MPKRIKHTKSHAPNPHRSASTFQGLFYRNNRKAIIKHAEFIKNEIDLGFDSDLKKLIHFFFTFLLKILRPDIRNDVDF